MAQQSAYSASLLSRTIKISGRQLQRYTQEIFKQSPQAWLNGERLALAATLLLKERSAKIVAFQLGFKQASHFSREFKHYHGISPKVFLQLQ
jgi:AraC-like DNA-binding protein